MVYRSSSEAEHTSMVAVTLWTHMAYIFVWWSASAHLGPVDPILWQSSSSTYCCKSCVSWTHEIHWTWLREKRFRQDIS